MPLFDGHVNKHTEELMYRVFCEALTQEDLPENEHNDHWYQRGVLEGRVYEKARRHF